MDHIQIRYPYFWETHLLQLKIFYKGFQSTRWESKNVGVREFASMKLRACGLEI